MKFTPHNWLETAPGVETPMESGVVRLNASVPCAFYITANGDEALASYGTSIDVTVGYRCTVRAEPTAKNCRVFYYDTGPSFYLDDSEIFTNVDRTPLESGTMDAVRKALRLHALEQRGQRDKMRAATKTARRAPRSCIRSAGRSGVLSGRRTCRSTLR